LTEPGVPALSADIAALDPTTGLDTELRLRLPADVACIEEAVELVVQHVEPRVGSTRTVRFNLRVALTEAICNAIVYGSDADPARRVDVRVAFGPRRIEMEVTDEGDGFDPAQVPDPTAPDRVHRADGRGLFLIRHLVHELAFNERGNTIRMVLCLP
jgi:serine/threonine-protein kinase RsbW